MMSTLHSLIRFPVIALVAIGAAGLPGPHLPGNVPIPTLPEWGLALLSALMAGWAMLIGFVGRGRRK